MSKKRDDQFFGWSDFVAVVAFLAIVTGMILLMEEAAAHNIEGCKVTSIAYSCPTDGVDPPNPDIPGPVVPDVTPPAPPVIPTPPVTGGVRYQTYQAGADHLMWRPGQVGVPSEWWNLPIDDLPVSPQSAGVIAYLNQAERAFNGNPRIEGDANQPFGDPTPERTQELNWRLDRGRAYTTGGADYEGYGQSVHVIGVGEPSDLWDGVPYALIDGDNTPLGPGEDSWYVPHCDKVLMPIAPMSSPLQPQIAPRVRVQGNTHRRCGPFRDPLQSGTTADCHYNVIDLRDGTVIEHWRARGVGLPPGLSPNGANRYSAGCTAVFNLSEKQDPELRGWSISSANVAGVPYTPFLVTPAEIEAGVIHHAIAVAIYNHWMMPGAYVRGEGRNLRIGGATHASHSSVVDQYWQDEMPGWLPMMIQPAMGSRFRLRADFPIDPNWPKAVRVILVAMKVHGVYLIDGTFGGTFVALSNDAFSHYRWTEVNTNHRGNPENLHPLALELEATIGWQDFEMVSVYEADGVDYLSTMPGYGLDNERPSVRSARYPLIQEF